MKNTGLTWIENIRSTRKLQTMGPWKWIPCTTDVFKILFFLSQVTFLFGQSVGFRWDAPLSITTTTSSVVNDIVLVEYVCMWYVVFFDYLILHSLFTHRKPIPRESAFIPLFLLLFCRGLKSPQKNPKKWLLWIFFFTFPGACTSKADLSCCTNHFGAPCTWWLRPWVPWGLKPEHPRISGWWF